MKISFITTCKGRLMHLEKTLPKMYWQLKIAPEDFEVVVVDYGDPDNCYKYAYTLAQNQKFESAKIIKVLDNTNLWNPGRARNIGAVHATGDIFFFIDADIIPQATAAHKVYKLFAERDIIAFKRNISSGNGSKNGTFGIRADAFHRVRGYNELGIGWCFEDVDLYRRMGAVRQHRGKVYVIEDSYLNLKYIKHGFDVRSKFVEDKDISSNRAKNLELFNQSRRNVNPDGYGICRSFIL